jgi:hypothetical protein
MMKNTTAVVCLLAVTLGAVSAAVTTTLLVDTELEGGAGSPLLGKAVVAAPAGTEALDQVRELREENRALRERLEALELRPAVPVRQPALGFAKQEDFDALRDELREWMAKGGPAPDEESELRDLVGTALSSIRKEEAIANLRKAQEKKTAKLEERVTNLSAWLTLDEYQANEVRAILTDKDARDQELIRLWEEGTDDETLGEIKRTNNEALWVATERVLNPQQFETFAAKYGDNGKN